MATSLTPELIHNLDLSNVYGSVLAFADQVSDAWVQAEKIEIPPDYSEIKNVVVAAMGGSALGARVISALYSESLKVPLEIVNDYRLPSYVGKETLVIADSYSGTTEETLASYEEAKNKGAKIYCTAAGGTLSKIASEDKVPLYTINPIYNPSNQPRMSLGYSIGSMSQLLSKLKLIDLRGEEVKKACAFVKNLSGEFKLEKANNNAINTAEGLFNKIPILIAASHLLGASHAAKNQINENAKTFAAAFPIPELNHHLIESLKFPESNPTNLAFVFYESELYLPRTQKRFKLTKELAEKNGIRTYTYKVRGENKLEQALEVVQFGAFVGFYLSMLNGINPAPIPTVDWFKVEMEK